MWYLYILKCKNGYLYTGITTDIKRRLDEHRTAAKTHFTGRYYPEKLIYTESFLSETKARAREIQIKGWTRAKKLALARGDKILLKTS